MEKLVKRSGKVAFMNVSTTGISNFQRMTKFTEISKSKNASEYSRNYVDEDGEITDVTGYSEEISYAFDLYAGNLVHASLVDITDGEKTGNDALRQILTVDLSKPMDNGYEARLRTYSVIPDSEGDSTDAYTYSGSFRKNSGFVVGKAVISEDKQTATFTPNESVAEYPVVFLVKDSVGAAPIESAKITIEGTSYLTDATGIATLELAPKSYSNVKIEKTGYTTQSNVSVTVSDKPILKEIALVESK